MDKNFHDHNKKVRGFCYFWTPTASVCKYCPESWAYFISEWPVEVKDEDELKKYVSFLNPDPDNTRPLHEQQAMYNAYILPLIKAGLLL